jgi:hypothetical protein
VRGGRGHERVLQFSLRSANLARWILHQKLPSVSSSGW